MQSITATVKIYRNTATVTALGLALQLEGGGFSILNAIAFGNVATALNALPAGAVIRAQVDFTTSKREVEISKEVQVKKGSKTVTQTVLEKKMVDVPGLKIIRFDRLDIATQEVLSSKGTAVVVPAVLSAPMVVSGRLGADSRFDEKSQKSFMRMAINDRYLDRTSGEWVSKTTWVNVVASGQHNVTKGQLVQVVAQPSLYDGRLELIASEVTAASVSAAA